MFKVPAFPGYSEEIAKIAFRIFGIRPRFQPDTHGYMSEAICHEYPLCVISAAYYSVFGTSNDSMLCISVYTVVNSCVC